MELYTAFHALSLALIAAVWVMDLKISIIAIMNNELPAYTQF